MEPLKRHRDEICFWRFLDCFGVNGAEEFLVGVVVVDRPGDVQAHRGHEGGGDLDLPKRLPMNSEREMTALRHHNLLQVRRALQGWIQTF